MLLEALYQRFRKNRWLVSNSIILLGLDGIETYHSLKPLWINGTFQGNTNETRNPAKQTKDDGGGTQRKQLSRATTTSLR